MAFVKLDCAVLHSSLWPDKDARDVFITALLMASPHELIAPAKQIRCTSLDETGWEIPPGWYGFVAAAGVGIINMASVDKDRGLLALERLCSPESESRNPSFEGRRMARIDGGYIVLNYISYRDRDHGAATRMKRFREREKLRRNSCAVTLQNSDLERNVTHSREQRAEAEADSIEERARATTAGDNPSVPDSGTSEGPDPANEMAALVGLSQNLNGKMRGELRRLISLDGFDHARNALERSISAKGTNISAVQYAGGIVKGEMKEARPQTSAPPKDRPKSRKYAS